MNKKGFTLIEILVVVSIIGVLMSLTLLGLQGSRQSSRDAKRKSDIELVRSGLELFKADCKKYPSANIFASTRLTGDGSLTSCATTNIYISQLPVEPFAPERAYVYYSNGIIYELCTSLEGGSAGPVTCGTTTTCGGSNTCNHKAINP